MTESEFQSLIEFIAPRFDAFDARFDAIETRLVRVEIGQEQQAGQIRLLAEGLGSFREETERRFEQVEVRFDAQDVLVRGLFEDQRRRLEHVETRISRSERP